MDSLSAVTNVPATLATGPSPLGRLSFHASLWTVVTVFGYGLFRTFYYNPVSKEQEECLHGCKEDISKNTYTSGWTLFLMNHEKTHEQILTEVQGRLQKALKTGLEDELRSPALKALLTDVTSALKELKAPPSATNENESSNPQPVEQPENNKVLTAIDAKIDRLLNDTKKSQQITMAAGGALLGLTISAKLGVFNPLLRAVRVI